jgi:hypothetical protein
MRRVTDLDHASARRRPTRLRVPPEELKIDDGVGWRGLDKFLEDRRPFDLLHARHVFHTLQHLLLLDSVVPAFLLSTGNLWLSVTCLRWMIGYLHRGS